MAKKTNNSEASSDAPKEAKTPKAKKAVIKHITVKVHKPGELPGEVKVEAGSTISALTENMNLAGYEIKLIRGGSIVNGTTGTVLEANDLIRVGVKTKNN